MRNVLYDMSTNSADSSRGKSRTCVNFVKCPVVKDTNPHVNKHNNELKLLNSITVKTTIQIFTVR